MFETKDHLDYLQEIFYIKRTHNMKLNLEKYDFGVGFGKFLGFLVSNKGIKVNPENIKAIEEIPDVFGDFKVVRRLI